MNNNSIICFVLISLRWWSRLVRHSNKVWPEANMVNHNSAINRYATQICAIFSPCKFNFTYYLSLWVEWKWNGRRLVMFAMHRTISILIVLEKCVQRGYESIREQRQSGDRKTFESDDRFKMWNWIQMRLGLVRIPSYGVRLACSSRFFPSVVFSDIHVHDSAMHCIHFIFHSSNIFLYRHKQRVRNTSDDFLKSEKMESKMRTTSDVKWAMHGTNRYFVDAHHNWVDNSSLEFIRSTKENLDWIQMFRSHRNLP